MPVEKRGERHEAKILNPDAHLMLYWISPHSFEGTTAADDQLGAYEMDVYRSVYLAVPTKKVEWGD